MTKSELIQKLNEAGSDYLQRPVQFAGLTRLTRLQLESKISAYTRAAELKAQADAIKAKYGERWMALKIFPLKFSEEARADAEEVDRLYFEANELWLKN